MPFHNFREERLAEVLATLHDDFAEVEATLCPLVYELCYRGLAEVRVAGRAWSYRWTKEFAIDAEFSLDFEAVASGTYADEENKHLLEKLQRLFLSLSWDVWGLRYLYTGPIQARLSPDGRQLRKQKPEEITASLAARHVSRTSYGICPHVVVRRLESPPEAVAPVPVQPEAAVTTKQAKRSTEQQEAFTKLAVALLQHHQYYNRSCLEWEAIGNNKLAQQAGVTRSSASRFFKQQFGGHGKYKTACLRQDPLLEKLGQLDGEYFPHRLYGKTPPGERSRRDA